MCLGEGVSEATEQNERMLIENAGKSSATVGGIMRIYINAPMKNRIAAPRNGNVCYSNTNGISLFVGMNIIN